MQNLILREGCVNIPTPCPNPIIWGIVGLIVGLWLASVFWLVYIDYKRKQEEEMGDEE